MDSESDKSLLVERHGNILLLKINRENRLNALNTDLYDAIYTKLVEANDNLEINAVVITGGSRSFCAGADVSEFATFNKWQEFYRFELKAKAVYDFIENMEKIVIAAVDGYVLGGGLELALSTDIVISSEDTIFGFPEVHLGMIPGTGGSQKLPRIAGKYNAKYYMMTGKFFNAERAFDLGIVSEIVQRNKLIPRTLDLLGEIFENPAQASFNIKRAVNTGMDMPVSAALKFEQEINNSIFESREIQEKIGKFKKKEVKR